MAADLLLAFAVFVASWLGTHGVQRVHAAVGEDDRLALQVLRQVGFVVYTGDEVLRLERPESWSGAEPADDASEPPEAAVTADTAHALGRLAESGLPRAAHGQMPESGADWGSYPVGGLACRGVLVGVQRDKHGGVTGGWRAVAGNRGSWLRLVTGAEASGGQLVASAIGSMRADRRFRGQPLYAAPRGYEPDHSLALRDAGFEVVARRYRLVRHATVRVLAPAWAPSVRHEAALGHKPTSVQSHGSPRASGDRP
jgi:hypothetical protein